jgi:hypothetical protein
MLYGVPNLNTNHKREVVTMYVDEYVIAGFIIIGLTCSLFYGFYRFIKSDIEKHKNDPIK